MEGYQNRQTDRTGHPAARHPQNGLANVRRPMAPEPEGTGRVVALDLVQQAANLMQSIEDRAAETIMRAHELARRATEQFELAQRRIRDLERAQGAAEARINEMNARAEQAEQETRAAHAQIAAIADRLGNAEARAKNSEARAIEAERTLLRVEEALQTQLLARRQPLTNVAAVAA